MPNFKRLLLIHVLAACSLLAPERAAFAEPPPGGYGDAPADGYAAEPTAQPVYAQPTYATAQPVQQQPAAQPATAEEGRGIEYGFHLIVPIWLTDLNNASSASPDVGVVRAAPGIGIQGRIGWEFPGGLSGEINLGAMINNVSYSGTISDQTLNAFWLGAGLRYSFLNRTAWVPFIGVGLQLTGWGDSVCGSGCSRTYTLGANGIVGLVLEINQFLGIEAGVQVMGSSKGETFSRPQLIVSPLAGLTLYYY